MVIKTTVMDAIALLMMVKIIILTITHLLTIVKTITMISIVPLMIIKMAILIMNFNPFNLSPSNPLTLYQFIHLTLYLLLAPCVGVHKSVGLGIGCLFK